MSSSVEAQVRQALRQISAVDLQKLAEDLACVKFPERFSRNVLRRAGRNDENQTIKGWPDAFVSTGTNLVDGIEATRQASSWVTHLAADLAHASDPAYRSLSGYVFVGGYPDHSPTALELDDWIEKFASLTIDRSRITILVGSDLVAELTRPEYAAVRQMHLGINSTPIWFRLLGHIPLNDKNLSLFQPSQDDYACGRVASPTIMEGIVDELLLGDCVLVQGTGAAGKTTLAELIARHPQVAPRSVWYTDLVRTTEEEAGHVPLNEMTELASTGTLFILDNVHLDIGYAATLHDHWNRFLRPLGSRLLLMGRQTQRVEKRFGFVARQHILRAGSREMLSVVERLAARDQIALPSIPSATVGEWGRIFGGSEDPSDIAVDLVAFTAAVDSRLKYFGTGDFRLLAAHSYDAVRARYLEPLSEEFPNVVRLAAFAAFEIPLALRQLPDPVVGLTKSVNALGLVIEEELGLEGTRHYRLIHSAVGALLLGAVGTVDENDERLRAIAHSPALALRLLGSPKWRAVNGSKQQGYLDALQSALLAADWPRGANSFYELANLAAHLVKKLAADPASVDLAVVESCQLETLMARPVALPAVTQFLSRASSLLLSHSIVRIDEVLAKGAMSATICASLPSDVAALARLAPSGKRMLSLVDQELWRQSQVSARVEVVTQSIGACRVFESLGRSDLARPIASRQIALADPHLWNNADFDHLSQAVRYALASDEAINLLFEALEAHGWMSRSLSRIRLGPLCGSLMALANHLGQDLRDRLLTSELKIRVTGELATRTRRGETSRPICLLGGYTALGGSLDSMPSRDWSDDPKGSNMLLEVAHSDTGGAVGMYELQLWLGLMALDLAGVGPRELDLTRGTSFATRLSNSPAPTESAALTGATLLAWLQTKLKSQATLHGRDDPC